MITFQRLLTRLIWICIIPLVILALIMAVVFARSVQREIDLAADNLAANIIVSVDQNLNAHIAGLQTLAASPLADKKSRWNDLYNEARGYRKTFGTDVIFSDPDDHMRFNTDVPFGNKLPTYMEGQVAALVDRKTGQPEVGDSFPGPFANQSVFEIVVPVMRDSAITGFFLTTVETGALQTQLDKLAKPTGWSVTLLDGKGTFIAGSGSASARPLVADNNAALQFKAGSSVSHWQIVVEIPRDVYWWPVTFTLAVRMTALLIAIFLGMIGGRITGRKLAASVASLAESSGSRAAYSDIAEIASARQRLDKAAEYRAMVTTELEKFKIIIESTEDAIISKSLNGTITSWNHGAEMMFGYTALEALGHQIDILIPPERQYEEPDILEHIARGEKMARFETVRRCKDGRKIVVSASISPIFDAENHPVGASKIVRDITEQTMARDQIQSGKLMLEAAMAGMTDAVFISDLNGNFVQFNEAFATFHRFRNKDECATTLAEFPVFLDVFLPDGALLALEQWAVPRALGGESGINAEYTLHRRDTGESWIGSYNFAPIRNTEGKILGSVVTARDITERVKNENEIRMLNVDLEKRVFERTAELTASNQELDSFAYAVSHDLRGPLRAMSGFSQALVEDFGEQLQGEAKNYLNQIEIASHKMSELIDGILALSRITRGELKQNIIDISAMATNLLGELENSEPGRSVEWQVQAGLAALGDPRLIEAALRNLLGNAWKYTGKTDHPVIRLAAVDVDGQPGLCVSDNGAGFDMAHIERLFKPFQRLHRQDEFPGLGIGLATVQRIIKRHGGVIRAHGQLGHGAMFSFTLPAKNQKEST